MSHRFIRLLSVLLICLSASADPLPWQSSFTNAVARAKAEHKPIFLMLSENGCSPCKMLEKSGLPDSKVRDGLKEFIWYHANEEHDLDKKYVKSGFPTCVILDSNANKVLAKTVGYGSVPSFLSFVMEAREKAGLPLTPELARLKAVHFEPDYSVTKKMIDAGDADGLVKYLAPAKADYGREYNYFIGKINFPPGVKASDAMVTPTIFPLRPLGQSGMFLKYVPRQGDLSFGVLAKGCKKIEQSIRVDDAKAVQIFTFNLEPINETNAASFSGRVLYKNGQPVPNAIVRICDWDYIHADAMGHFAFAKMSPGKFTVRAEAPGGEWQEELKFQAGKKLTRDLKLQAVTTIGIRWAVQTKEGSLALTGPDVTTGEACFSASHSRFDLHRGAEVRQYFGSDFMCSEDLTNLGNYLNKGDLPELKAHPGQPFFYLFDKSIQNGLHAEATPYTDIKCVNNNIPPGTNYFKFLRGAPLHKGQVYTVRCCLPDCYAKLEITDVTIVPH